MVLEKTLESPLDCKEIKQSILKETIPEYSLEGLLLKRRYFGHPMQRANSSENTLGKDWGQEEKGATEDEVVGRHHRLDGHELELTSGDSEGQGSQACCSPWGLLSRTRLKTEQEVPGDTLLWVQALTWQSLLTVSYEQCLGAVILTIAWVLCARLTFF